MVHWWIDSPDLVAMLPQTAEITFPEQLRRYHQVIPEKSFSGLIEQVRGPIVLG
jgi:hypothetical protein